MSDMSQRYIERLGIYKENCSILKQINSNKAYRYNFYHQFLSISTIIATTFLTAIGFMDRKIITTIFFSSGNKLINAQIELVFNFAVLIVLILTILSMTFKFQEKSSDYNRAVILLASLIRDIDDIIEVKGDDKESLKVSFNILKAKYDNIVDLLPQHSDKSYIKATKDLYKKERNIDELLPKNMGQKK